MSQKERDAGEIIRRRVLNEDPERLARVEAYRAELEVGQAIYDLRTGAGLTQAELAERVRTSVSAVSRLEDAEYQGHSLSMLRRVAAALGKRVEFRFVNAAEGADALAGAGAPEADREREPAGAE